jgi:hypothetical protein
MGATIEPTRKRRVVAGILLATVAAFLAVTLYDVTINGCLEPVSLFPDHFDAGAGSTTFVVRVALLLAILVLVPFVIWRPDRALVSAVRTSIAAVLSLFVMVWSACGIQREARQYDHAVFDEVVQQIISGRELSKRDVVARLGPPLVSGLCGDDYECWSYTYMPSGGFGWQHRVVSFDRAGRVVSWIGNDEP